MEKVSRWLLIGVLAYIGAMLTSINNKIDDYDLRNTEYAVLNEVKPQSFTGNETETTASNAEVIAPASFSISPTYAAIAIVGLIGIFITWNISKFYHGQRWSREVMHKSYTQYREPIVQYSPRDLLHPDQDAVWDKPLTNGRIKDSWLPTQARRLYSGWSGRES